MSLPQGLTASKSVGRLRTFGVRMSMSSLLRMSGSRVVAATPMTAESPKRIASLSSTAAGFLQPFFKQSDEPPASRKSSVSKVSAEADVFNN